MDEHEDLPRLKKDLAAQLTLTKMRLHSYRLENDHLKRCIVKLKAERVDLVTIGIATGLFLGWAMIKLIKSTI